MDNFGFLFAVYSLTLGLSMVELLAGVGRAIEARLDAQHEGRAYRIGWLTPLLGIFVMLDLLSFWLAAWVVRADVAVTARSVLGVVAFASLYYLAARLVFPAKPEQFATLDSHYGRVRRIIFGLLIALMIAQLAYYVHLPRMAAMMTHPMVWATSLLMLILMVAATWVRSYRWSLALLGLLILRYCVIFLL